MPSGDSSPYTGMDVGRERVKRRQGDESPDGINAVPTVMIS